MSKKRRYIVVPRTTEATKNGLVTGKGKVDFKGKTAAWVSDPAQAEEINTQYGLKGSGDVWVEQDENLEWHDKHDGLTDGKMTGIHHYTFQGVDMSNIRTTRDNGYVWAHRDGKQVRMPRQEAIEENLEIVGVKNGRKSKSKTNHAAPVLG